MWRNARPAIGLERLEENGITAESLREDDLDALNEIGLDEDAGNDMYDAFGACDVDVPALLVESLAGDENVPSEALDCLEGALDDDLVREIMVVTITQGDDALDQDSELGQRVNDTFAECAPDGG